MIRGFRTLTNIGIFHNKNTKKIKSVKNIKTNLFCGRDNCLCLLNLNLDSEREKNYYNNCYDKWYKYNMKNMLELD
jgi:hypothetical protein